MVKPRPAKARPNRANMPGSGTEPVTDELKSVCAMKSGATPKAPFVTPITGTYPVDTELADIRPLMCGASHCETKPVAVPALIAALVAAP